MRLARTAWDRFADGAVFVALASIRDEGLFESTVAGALQLRKSGTASIGKAMTSNLSRRETLLVLLG